MKQPRLVTLYSGSGGNSTFVSSGTTNILIDAGKSARSLCCALRGIGSDISEIDAIFITHEHADHVSALEVLSKKHSIPIHMTVESAKKFDGIRDCPLDSLIVRHDTVFSETVGDMTVSSFRTPHDSRMSVGYRISLDSKGYCLGVATDIGYVTPSIRQGLDGCLAVVLESNHDIAMLEDGPYPEYLKNRILSKRGHLCNSDSACLAAELVRNGTQGFILAHLSAENNLPELAYDEYLSIISDSKISIAVAAPDAPTELDLSNCEVCKCLD